MDTILDILFMIAGMAIGWSLPYIFLYLSNYKPRKLFKLTIVEDEVLSLDTIKEKFSDLLTQDEIKKLENETIQKDNKE